MSSIRSASRVTPILLRGASRAPRRIPRGLPREISAIAILIPTHGYATDTSTSTQSGTNYPPPGFNAEEAKKPLPKDEQHKSTLKSQADKEAVKTEAHKNGSTAHAKTDAAEAQSLTELAAEKAAEDKAEEKKLAKKTEEQKKLTIWQKVKREAHHYWDGTKLLATEVRISSKLALKMAAGYELTRRENRQVRSRFNISEMRIC